MMARHVIYLMMAMIFGTLSLFQSSPYMVWAMLELNLFMIIPFLLNRSQFCHPTKGAVIYFGCQSIASILMVSGIIMQDLGWAVGFSILILGFLCKLGVFPFYSWVPRTMVSLSWVSCLVLLTFQKVFPIFCMPEVLVSSIVGGCLGFALVVSAVMAGTMLFFQANLKSGLGYSSVLNMSWVLSLKLVDADSMGQTASSNTTVSLFLIVYIPVVLSVIGLFMVTGAQTLADVALCRWGQFRWVSYLCVLSLGGVPGLMGFLPKLIVVSSVVGVSPGVVVGLLSSSAFGILWYTCPVVMAGVNYTSIDGFSDSPNVRKMMFASAFFNIMGAPVLIGVILWLM